MRIYPRFFLAVLFSCLLLLLLSAQCKTWKVNLIPSIFDGNTGEKTPPRVEREENPAQNQRNKKAAFSTFEIYKAVEEGDLDKVKAILEKNPHLVNSKDENGRTPLICAVSAGHEDLVEFLLSRGAVPDREYVSRNEGTLLHTAAAKGLKKLCGRLIESDFDVDAKDRYGLTPMHMAALANQKKVADLLISKGADLNAQGESAWTPLRCAQEMNHMELVEFLVLKGASCDETGLTNMKGKYFGQAEAGFNPQLFSPGIVSSIFLEHSPVEFSPDGREAYWTSDFRDFGPTEGRIYISKQLEGRWGSPRIAPFSEKLNCYNPVFSHDGNKLYFFAALPTANAEEPVPNIFVAERKEEGWSEPQIVEIPNIRGYLMTQFSIARDGTLYYAINPEDDKKSWDIYRSRLVEGHYTEPESLGGSINTSHWESYPYIDREQRYLIFTSMGRLDSFGSMDLYISFQKDDGSWTEAVNMGDRVNSSNLDTFATVSPDGKWLFFVSGRNGNVDVYWMDAGIIDDLGRSFDYPLEVREYLKPGKYVDSHSEIVVRKADELTRNSADPIERARILFEFVRDDMDETDFDKYQASDVLKNGGGFCYNKAILLAALCRAAGVPARIFFDEVRVDNVFDEKKKTFFYVKILHGITEIYLAGKWIKYDQTGNAKRINIWNRLWLKEDPVKIELPLEFSIEHDVVFPLVGKLRIFRTDLHFFDWSDEVRRLTEEFNSC